MNTPESNSVRVTRHLAASPERVFRAWITATVLERWLAPTAQADPQVGGRYRLEVSKPEAGTHVVTGEYRELLRDERIVATWVYEGPMAPEGAMHALLTVQLRADGSGTEIDVHHEHLTNPTYYEAIRSGAWMKALDQLEQVLAEQD